MKLVARAVTALTLLAFATPALPCGEAKQTQASTAQPSATTTKGAVAKADKKADKKAQKAEKKAAN